MAPFRLRARWQKELAIEFPYPCDGGECGATGQTARDPSTSPLTINRIRPEGRQRRIWPMSARTLDTSDIDQFLGKPIESSTLREPLSNNDIRRWAHAMHYPNLLHYDPDYAAAGRWGRLVAPQSFPIVADDG